MNEKKMQQLFKNIYNNILLIYYIKLIIFISNLQEHQDYPLNNP